MKINNQLIGLLIVTMAIGGSSAYALLGEIVQGVGDITQDVVGLPGDVVYGRDDDRERIVRDGIVGGTFDLADDIVSAPGDAYRAARDR